MSGQRDGKILFLTLFWQRRVMKLFVRILWLYWSFWMKRFFIFQEERWLSRRLKSLNYHFFWGILNYHWMVSFSLYIIYAYVLWVSQRTELMCNTFYIACFFYLGFPLNYIFESSLLETLPKVFRNANISEPDITMFNRGGIHSTRELLWCRICWDV